MIVDYAATPKTGVAAAYSGVNPMMFGEGDSGGPWTRTPGAIDAIPISSTAPMWAAYNEQQKATVEPAETVMLETNIFVGMIYQIASDQRNSPEVRVEAFKLIWSITMDRFRSGEMSSANE